jgi:hypothetical protein
MGADCKSVAKATVVRTHYLPPESAGSDGIWRFLLFSVSIEFLSKLVF